MPYRKRVKHYDIPGHAHALTFSCFRRQPFLTRDRCRAWLCEAIDQARTRQGFQVWAYVIMPEHAHLLVWPGRSGCKVASILFAIKKSSAARAVHFVKRHAPAFLERMLHRTPGGGVTYRFWQPGAGYDRNLFEPRTIHESIAYMHLNPVRRGLCLRPEDWRWSSASDWAGLEPGPLAIDRQDVPGLLQSGKLRCTLGMPVHRSSARLRFEDFA